MNATRDGTTLQDRTKLSLNGDARLFADIQPVPAAQVKGSARDAKNESREEMPFSGPLSVPSSSGFAWAAAQRPQEDRALARSRTRSSSRGQFPAAEADRDCTRTQATTESAAGHRELPSSRDMPRVGSKVREPEPHDAAKRAVLRKWSQLERPDSFDSCDTYHSQNFSNAMLVGVGGGALSSKNIFEVRRVDRLFTCYYGVMCVFFTSKLVGDVRFMELQGGHGHGQEEKAEYSGPLLPQSHKVDELLQKNERHIRQAVRTSWFRRGNCVSFSFFFFFSIAPA